MAGSIFLFDYLDQFGIYEFSRNGKRKIEKSLIDCLSEAVSRNVKFIRCGGDSPIAAAREQWNDGTNVLPTKNIQLFEDAKNDNNFLKDTITIVNWEKMNRKTNKFQSEQSNERFNRQLFFSKY